MGKQKTIRSKTIKTRKWLNPMLSYVRLNEITNNERERERECF